MNEEAVHGDAADAGALAPLAEHRRIAQALPWVEQVARSLAGRLGHHVPVDDLRSAGHFALMDVVRRYDPVIAPFEPYTRLRLRWAMLDEVRNNTKSRAVLARTAALDSSLRLSEARRMERRPDSSPRSEATYGSRLRNVLRQHATVMGMRLLIGRGGEVVVAPSSHNPERAVAKRARVDAVRDAIASLEPRFRDIIVQHYFKGESLAHIAHGLGHDASWISRLHRRAIEQLERTLRDAGVQSSKH